MTKFWQCKNCLDYYQKDQLTITEWLGADLKLRYIVVCSECLTLLEEMGITSSEEERIVDEYCTKYGLDIEA